MNTKTILVVAAIVVVLGTGYAIAGTGGFWHSMMDGYGNGHGMMRNGMMDGYGNGHGMMRNGMMGGYGNGSGMMGNGSMMNGTNGYPGGSQCGAANYDYGANAAP